MPTQPIRSKERFLVFGAPAIEDEDIAEVVQTLKSGWIGTGPRVAAFENAVKAYKNADHVAAVNSCTAALHLSILAAGIGPGDEVITTAMTFCASINAIIHAGATPVLADIEPASMNIDPSEIRKKITPRTRAIMPVHFAGLPCDMDAIMDIARERNVKIIEDCAHAIETEYKGQKAGTFGDFGCLSFYVTKNITTAEGGMVLAKKEEDIARIKTLALHGMTKDAWKRFSDEGYKHYQVVEAGFKYNMTDLQAAIGLHQVKRIERYWKRRREIWNAYHRLLSNLPVGVPQEPSDDCSHAYHLFALRISASSGGISRDEFLNAMTFHNIGVGVHYLSIPEHPYYQRRFGWKPQDYPNAMALGRETVSLPLSPILLDEDVNDVIGAVKKIVNY
ncbi:MAG TPA: DegT/DnrJ/EryC1/StrS family aminotransferase [Chitinivibrionales bacterium]